jgi:hypothetical protein
LIQFQPGPDGLARPYVIKPNQEQWEEFCFALAEQVRRHGYKMVVIDHLARFWSVKDERDDGQVEAAWAPLDWVIQAGATVVGLHHGNKYGGIRGSTAIPAFADHVLHFKQINANPLETRRTIAVSSRLVRTTFDLMLDLDFSKNAPVGEYVLVSDSRNVDGNDVLAKLLQKLPAWPPADKAKMVTDTGLTPSTFDRYYKRLRKDQACFGKCGVKNVYWKPTDEHPCAATVDAC